MKKKIRNLGLIAVVLLFTNFSFAQFQVALSGNISNIIGNTASIKELNEVVKVISVRDDGTFEETLDIPRSGIYSFVYARESTQIYLSDGFNLNIELNTAEFDESIKYSGKGAECNNYLASKFLIDEQVFGSYADYKLIEPAFLEKRDSVNNVYMQMLLDIDDKGFVEYEKRNIKYKKLLAISYYQGYHGYFTKDRSYKVSDITTSRFENLDYSNSDDYQQYDAYRSLVNSYYLKGISSSENLDSVILAIQKLKSSEIKEGVVGNLIESYLTITNSNVEQLYLALKKVCKQEEYMERITEKYESFQSLLKGNPSAKFAYQDVNGNTVRLDDLKGKFVYIDVWATWCSPCLGEIPHLKKLEADYHGKNIVFVSISVDNESAFDKWKKMVVDKELKGYQLYADKSWKSDFVQAYQIKGIPTFILIDPNGNIVSASAMRPSNPELRVLFDELLK